MNKDLSFMDYDAIEDNWTKLKQAKVLVADYDLIRNDFPSLKVLPPVHMSHHIQNKTKEEINNWLVDNTAYISEGQVKRILPGGDLNSLIDLGEGLEHICDVEVKNVGLRMKGAGIEWI